MRFYFFFFLNLLHAYIFLALNLSSNYVILLVYSLRLYTSTPLRLYASTPLRLYTSKPLRRYTSTPLRRYTSMSLDLYAATHLRLYTSTPLHLYTSTPLHLYTSTPLHLYTSTPLHLYTIKRKLKEVVETALECIAPGQSSELLTRITTPSTTKEPSQENKIITTLVSLHEEVKSWYTKMTIHLRATLQ